VQKTWYINGHMLLCMYLAEVFSGCLVLTSSHRASTAVNFWRRRVKQHSSNNSTEWQTCMSIDHPCGKRDLTYANPTLHKSSKNKFVWKYVSQQVQYLHVTYELYEYFCLMHCTVLKSSSIITCAITLTLRYLLLQTTCCTHDKH
jgi:hypothetical protein